MLRKNIHLLIAWVIILALLPSCAASPTPVPPTQTAAPVAAGAPGLLPTESELMALMERMVDKEKRATGMVIGMLAPGEQVMVGYGRLNETDSRVPGDGSLFEIGSISKVFIGTLLADSVQRGEVSLDDPISKYLPASVRAPEFNGTPITLLDLATHTSGLPRELETAPGVKLTPENWVQALYDFLSTGELTYKPGTTSEYSNLGMTLLAHILELRTGQPYETLLTERILGPLVMNDTFLPQANAAPSDRLATGHNTVLHPLPAEGYIYNEPERRFVGGIISSAQDMLKFASAAMGLTDTPLRAAFQEACKPLRPWGNNQHGLGWEVTEGSFPFIHHSGDTHGMHAFLGFDTQRQVAVVVLTNAGNPLDDLGPHLLHPKRYLLQTYTPRTLPTAKQLATEVLDSYAGQYELDGTVFTIKVDGRQLVVYQNGVQEFSMIAATETRFAVIEFEAWVTFIVKDGVVTSLVLDQAAAAADYTFVKTSP